MINTLLNLIEEHPMNEKPAIEFRLRPGPQGLVRHALLEDAAESFCGIDSSIMSGVSDLVQVTRVVNCPACMHGAQRVGGTSGYLRRLPGRAA